MTARPCAECGVLVDSGTYCDAHALPSRAKASSTRRGYDAAWNRLSTRARKLQPWCSDCLTELDLTCDHSPEAWARWNRGLPIRLADVAVVCRSCNSIRGRARPTDQPTGQSDQSTRSLRGQVSPEPRGDDPRICSPKPTDKAKCPTHPVTLPPLKLPVSP